MEIENHTTFNDLKLIDENKALKNQLDELKEDLYQFSFKNYIIDIGWYPCFSIKGEFKLVVIENENWSDEIIVFKTRNIKELKYILDEITIALNDEDFYRKIPKIKKLIAFRKLVKRRKK